MSTITILTEKELRACVSVDRDAVDVIERAFSALAQGNVAMPPIMSMALDDRHGELDVKTAYVPGMEGFAVKMSTGFFNNPALGLPSLNGLMVLLSAETGEVQSVLLDNGYLTDVRTAAAGAVAARQLAPERVRTVAVLGAGVQADLQLRALALVRDFDEVLVWARDFGKAERYATRMTSTLGTAVTALETVEECVRRADVVVTATPSEQPLVMADWLHPGLHITALGSDTPTKNELDPEVLVKADRFVCDRKTQSAVLGEMRAAIDAGLMHADTGVDELGEICAGQKPGREQPHSVTVCDLTGTGLQDTAIATVAFQRARDAGMGTVVES